MKVGVSQPVGSRWFRVSGGMALSHLSRSSRPPSGRYPHLLARDPIRAARANATQVENARRRAAAVLPYVEQARRTGAGTLAEIAAALMARGAPAPRGGHRWAPAQVRRVMRACEIQP